MALIGQNITPPDLVAKVTGRAKYAEDFRAEGMVFAKLLLSPMPHARVRRVDASEALAMPGVLGLLRADEVPEVSPQSEAALTDEPLYEGEPVLAVAAVDETTAADAVERIEVEFERRRVPDVFESLLAIHAGQILSLVGAVDGRFKGPQVKREPGRVDLDCVSLD